jgi:TonB family protein
MAKRIQMLIAFLILSGLGWMPRPTGQFADRPAPDFKLPDQSGQIVKLSDFRGQVVLIDIWTTECEPCQKTMPEIQALHEKYGPQGLKVISVNVEGKSPKVMVHLTKGGYTFTVLFDEGKLASQITQLYKVREIPYALLFDHNGFLRYQGHPHQVSEWFIERLLREARESGSQAVADQPRPKKDDVPPRRVSGTELQENVIHRVEPVYPAEAREAGIEGIVEVEVIVDEEGKVVAARVLSGDPTLGDAALAAVRQWKFRPILLEAKPAKVIGELRFRFRL